MTETITAGPWPPPPGWRPEVPPPFPPSPSPTPPPVHPPVPIVYERPSLPDDLADRLLDQRIVRVAGTLDLATVTDTSARLMLLDGSGDDPIDLIMSCPDGDLVAATALADTVELVGVELRALCSGTIGGPAVLPFALATRRLAQPHASVRLSDPTYDLQGRASDLAGEVDRQRDLLSDLHRRIAAATHQPLDRVVADFERRRVLTAHDAMEYGLVDEVVVRRGLRPL